MKVVRVEKDQPEEPLPLIVRDYILHDRGNSLFLGNSFGNLPSPVHESATIKRLFKFNEDEKAEKPNHSKNQQIRIEGKEKKTPEKKEPVNREFKVDLKEIDRIVFEETRKQAINQIIDNPYLDTKTPLSNANQSYVEEESYENPQNVSRVGPSVDPLTYRQEQYFADIRSEYINSQVDFIFKDIDLIRSLETDTVKLQSNFRDIEHATVEIAD